MNEKGMWLATTLLAGIAIICFLIPGLLNMNPWFFVYGGVTLLGAIILASRVLAKRRSNAHR